MACVFVCSCRVRMWCSRGVEQQEEKQSQYSCIMVKLYDRVVWPSEHLLFFCICRPPCGEELDAAAHTQHGTPLIQLWGQTHSPT